MSEIKRFSQQFSDYGIIENPFGDYCLFSDLSASQAREAELLSQRNLALSEQVNALEKLEAAQSTIHQFDACIQAFAKALGSPACGGVDVPIDDPQGTAGALVAAVDELRRELAELQCELAEEKEVYAETNKALNHVTAENAELRRQLAEWQQGENEDLTAAKHENAELQRQLEEAKVPEGWILVKQTRIDEILKSSEYEFLDCYRGRGIYDDGKVRANMNRADSALDDIKQIIYQIQNYDADELAELLSAAPTDQPKE